MLFHYNVIYENMYIYLKHDGFHFNWLTKKKIKFFFDVKNADCSDREQVTK